MKKTLAAVGAVLLGLVAVAVPSVRRYLKISRM
jgi:hypothetical protein